MDIGAGRKMMKQRGNSEISGLNKLISGYSNYPYQKLFQAGKNTSHCFLKYPLRMLFLIPLSCSLLFDSGCSRNDNGPTVQIQTSGNYAVIWRTTNGGNSWLKDSVTDDFAWNDIAATQDGHVIAISSRGKVYSTSDYGESWNFDVSLSDNSLSDIDFYGGGLGFITGEKFIFLTTNYGYNWLLTSSTAINHTDIDFFDYENGVCIAAGGSYEGNSMQTTNGGTSWFLIPSMSGMWLYDVEVFSPGTAYSVGKTSVNDTGIIMRTTDAGANWTRIVRLNDRDTHLNGITIELVGNNYVGIAYGRGIYRSTDIDSNWTLISNQGVELMGDDYNNGVFYIVGGNKILVSTDGSGWGVTNGPSNWLFNAITFIDENTGFVIGTGSN